MNRKLQRGGFNAQFNLCFTHNQQTQVQLKVFFFSLTSKNFKYV